MIGRNYLLIGPSGSGKTFSAKKIAQGHEVIFIHMNENVTYDNLIEGTQVKTNNGNLTYITEKQKLLRFIDNAKKHLSEDFYIILDDMNRSNMAAVLGELIYAFQDRNKEITLKSGTKCSVSSNVFLIVTLNCSEEMFYGNSVQREFFDSIMHMKNNAEEFEIAIEYIKHRSYGTVGKKEYQDFIEWLKSVYDKYVNQYCIFTREYRQDAETYKLGMSYFLPSVNTSINRWNECVYHRIRHQVHPLLHRYAADGIIKREYIPDEYVNDTEYIAEPIKEEHIKIHKLLEYQEYEKEFEINKTLPIGKPSKANSSHKVNWQYVVLSIILEDMITYSLINQHDLLEMLVDDSDILTFRNDLTVRGRKGGCLLVEDDLAPLFPVKDNASGNQRGGYSYSNNYHKYTFSGKKYRMFSAWQASNKVKCPRDISKCIETDAGIQKRHLYKTLKVLIYKYFKRYETNLNCLLSVDSSNTYIEDKLIQLQQDIELVEELTDDTKFSSSPAFIDLSTEQNAVQFIEFIRNLPTWKNMKTECGVYRIMSKNYKDIMSVTNVKQMILQGPPGTSKTYGAKKFIAEQIGISGDDWEEQLKECQLRTVNDSYEIKTGGKRAYWDLLQFHPSYTYEDFVRGISVKPVEKKVFTGEISGDSQKYAVNIAGDSGVAYKSVNRAMGKIAALAREEYLKDKVNCPDFYLVVDEINRANLATVFGELIYAFEYRGEEGVIRTPYEIDGDDSLVLPPNLYIIGTMNTADKSIGTIDYAIRRRFLFFKLLPDVEVVKESVKNNNPIDDINKSLEVKQFIAVEKLFENCLNKQDYEREDVQLGHTYFLRKTADINNAKEHAKLRFIYQVVPILFEYKKDGVIDLDRIKYLPQDYKWKDVLECIVAMINADDATRDSLYQDFIDYLNMPEIDSELEES